MSENAPEFEPERLVASAEANTSTAENERLWQNLEARLSSEVAPHASESLEARMVNPDTTPIQRRWWIEALTGIAALILFSLMLGKPGGHRDPEKHSPGGDDGKSAVVETDEKDPAPLLEKLKSEKQAERREAFLALLRGGKRTHTAIQEFKPGNDAEQNRAVDDLKRGYAIIDRLGAPADSETLAFWQKMWEAEASIQPEIWDVGLELDPKDAQPSAPPSPLLADAITAKYGEQPGAALKERFTAAFKSLKQFQKWSREKTNDNTDRLTAISKSGVAVAPVVLKTLILNLASSIYSAGRPVGERKAYPEDHLRMMVAAVALNLHEAEPLLMRFVPDYPTSPTIQGNAINALWRLAGRADRPFPLDIAHPTGDEVAAIEDWWREKQKNAPKGKFDADIEMILNPPTDEFMPVDKIMKAGIALLRGGEEARAAVRAHPRVNKLKEVLKAFEVMDTLGDDTQSLAFWQAIWNGEAQFDPWIWSYGINAEGILWERRKPPVPWPLIQFIVVAKFGDDSGKQINERFKKAFDAYVQFRNWERDGWGKPANPEHEKMLKAIEDAGVAVAPPILKLLNDPIANVTHNRDESKRLTDIEEGKIPPLPTSLDHLRMIVAADRLKLREAEMIIMEKIALSYPLSQTIQEHAVAAVYRLNGNTDEVKNFPFDIATNGTEWFAKFCAWWLEGKTKWLKTELASDNSTRLNSARSMAATITVQILPSMRIRQDDAKKNFPEIAKRLSTAIEEFSKVIPGDLVTPAQPEGL